MGLLRETKHGGIVWDLRHFDNMSALSINKDDVSHSNFKCERCDIDCHSKIGIFSHQICCSINLGANP